MTTKEKIIKAATQAFNEKGYGAVNLKELAKRMGISRGNLAYHFKDKELLLAVIVAEMWKKIREEKLKAKQSVSFKNLRSLTQMYYSFQQEYSFIFLDTQVTNHPIVKGQFRAMVKQSVEDFEDIIAFGIQAGNLKEEQLPGTYKSLAFSVWMIGFYWLSQQITRGEKTVADAEKVIWNLVLPYMTQKGIAAFKQFYGETFYKELGEPFNAHSKSFVIF